MFSRIASRAVSCSLPRSLPSLSSYSSFSLSSHRSFSSASTGGVLVFAEHNNNKLNDSTLNAITAARKLNPSAKITVLVSGSGDGLQSVASTTASVNGVGDVIVANHSAYQHCLAENVSDLIVELQKKNGYQYIVAPATANGKNVLPRAAAVLDVQPVSDVIEVKSADTFVRPIYAGNVLATVQSTDAIKLLTIRPTAFEKASSGSAAAPISSYQTSGSADKGLSKWIKNDVQQSARPELQSARIVVSGGRGMKSAESFKLLESLADLLGGAVGASRAAVDSGFAPNDLQVGQTGKVVAPELYFAVGISGAIQHLAGMKDSKCIVAINKDADAPIFQVADYGLVDDLFKAVPAFTEKVKQGKSA